VSEAPPAGRAGAALGVGALFGVLVAVPALVRLTASGAGGSIAVLALTGGSALVLGPMLVAVERARDQGVRLGLWASGVGLATWPLAHLGSLLERTTHHRPLGAATFVVLALGAVLGCLLVARRVGALDSGKTGRRGASLALALAGALSTGVVVVGALRVDAVRPHLLDGLLLVVAGVLGWVTLRRPAVVTALARVGVVLWIAFVAGYVVALTRPSFDQIRAVAPVLSGPAGWL
jgi:hypothetical protein